MQRWYEISKNPNVPEVKLFRKNALVQARKEKIIDNRIDYLCNLVKGKDVLDVGVVAHDANFSQNPNWLHKHLFQAAKTCTGLDILEEDVAKLNEQGFNVICFDLIKEPLQSQFDVIICGEVLEHLDAPGYLLSNCRKMLKPKGILVITIPNPWYIGYMIKNVFNDSPLQDNADHVSWFDPCTLCELGERQGLVLKSFQGIRHTEHNERLKIIKTIFFNITSLWLSLGFKPELFCKTMIYEFGLSL